MTSRVTPLRIELARETDAADLARFAEALGLEVGCSGTTVDIRDGRDDICQAVTTWLASRRMPLVPAGGPGDALRLRPPAD